MIAPADSPAFSIDPLRYDRLVMKLALAHGAHPRFVRDSTQYADGWVGLLKAIADFDPNEGTFMKWAHDHIKGYIRNGKRDDRLRIWWGPRAKVLNLTDVSEDDLERPRRWFRRGSHEATVRTRVGVDWGATTGLGFCAKARDAVEDVVDRDTLAHLLPVLGDRECRLVWRVKAESWTMEEAGKAEDRPITYQRVQQVIKDAMPKLRARAEELGIT